MKRGLAGALGIAVAWCALIGVIHHESPRTRLSAHGLLHVAIAESCQRSPCGTFLTPLPPENPLFAGEPLPYYFFFHRVALALASSLRIDVAAAFELLLLFAAAAIVVVGWSVGRRLFQSDAAGLVTSFLLFAGAHPQGPLVLLVRRLHDGPRIFDDDGSYLWGLLHPLNGALRIGDYYGTLGPLISTCLNLTARPLALAALLTMVLLLDVAAARPSWRRFAALALATWACTLFNPVAGIAAAGALALGLMVVAIQGGRSDFLSPSLALALSLALAIGVAMAWPWWHHLLHGLTTSARAARAVRLQFNGHRAVAIVTGAWLIAAFAWCGRRRLAGVRRRLALALLAAAALLASATAFVSLPAGNEDNLFHAALVLLAVPAAGVVVPLVTRSASPAEVARATRRRALVAVSLFLPMLVCVLVAYVGRPPLPIAFTASGLARLPVDGDEARLYAWIRADTPGDAVFVEDPGTDGRTCAGNTSELPALTGRSLFTDYARHYLVACEADAPLRAGITAKLTAGSPLTEPELAALRALGRPIFVVTVAETNATTARGPPLFQAGAIRVRRFEVR